MSGTIVQVDPLEDDAGARLGRPEAQGDVGPVEEPVAAHLGGTGKRALLALGFQHSLPHHHQGRLGEEEGPQFWSVRAPPLAG